MLLGGGVVLRVAHEVAEERLVVLGPVTSLVCRFGMHLYPVPAALSGGTKGLVPALTWGRYRRDD